MTTPTTLSEWLAYIEQQHPSSIAMGLERVREVAARLQIAAPAKHAIVVGGTNGKGSTVALSRRSGVLPAGRSVPTPRRICCATTSACVSMARRPATRSWSMRLLR